MSSFITWKNPDEFGDTGGILTSISARKLLQTRETRNWWPATQQQQQEDSSQRKEPFIGEEEHLSQYLQKSKSLEEDVTMGLENWEAKMVYHLSF